MVQAIARKPIGSPTASARRGDLVFDEDWLSSVETGAWSVIVDGSYGADGISFRKTLFDEHKNA